MNRKSGKQSPQSRQPSRRWRRMDLHIHTLASEDYLEPEISYLDILRQAKLRGLDIMAFTDHNSVAGYAQMKAEIENLTWLESHSRINAEEQRRLDEYRRLLDDILLLPGFEFTAMFGFHILGIFSPETPIRQLEHLLLNLNVPASLLDKGSTTPGSTVDVIQAYQLINDAGGIVIAAHVNTKNGVAMRGLDFGGQTRIAYTQDPNLHVLEVTDLAKKGRYTTRRFFSGSKPEYPRPMRCIQGSDAHRLEVAPQNPKKLGVGERVTEILLNSVSFEAIEKVLKGSDHALTRPFLGKAKPIDFVQLAREEGASINQAFHKSAAERGGNFNRILQDICAMANTNGGAIYVGATANPKEQPTGVREAKKLLAQFQTEISKRFSPEPEVEIDELRSQGKSVVRLTILRGQNAPYALDNTMFFVRDEEETSLAVRDEIVNLVLKNTDALTITKQTPAAKEEKSAPEQPKPKSKAAKSRLPVPRTGVEIVSSEKRKGTHYHTLRDLRNGNLINNVTKSSARKLWHYAISKTETGKALPKRVKWQNDIAVIDTRSKDDHTWYDLAMRNGNEIRMFFGVTDSGLNDAWLSLLRKNDQKNRHSNGK